MGDVLNQPPAMRVTCQVYGGPERLEKSDEKVALASRLPNLEAWSLGQSISDSVDRHNVHFSA